MPIEEISVGLKSPDALLEILFRHRERLRERTGTGKRVFVAMWFDDSMDDAFSNGIKPAAVDAGYETYRVKDDKHGERTPRVCGGVRPGGI